MRCFFINKDNSVHFIEQDQALRDFQKKSPPSGSIFFKNVLHKKMFRIAGLFKKKHRKKNIK